MGGLAAIVVIGIMIFQADWLGAWQSSHFQGEFKTVNDKVAAMNQQKLYAGSTYLLRLEYSEHPQFTTGEALYRNLRAMGRPGAAADFGKQLIKTYANQHDFRIQLAYDLADLGRIKEATQLLDQGLTDYHLDIFVAAQTEVNKRLQK